MEIEIEINGLTWIGIIDFPEIIILTPEINLELSD